MKQMDDFITACARALAGEDSLDDAVKNLPLPKSHIDRDYNNAMQMGQTLVDRLAKPIIVVEG